MKENISSRFFEITKISLHGTFDGERLYRGMKFSNTFRFGVL